MILPLHQPFLLLLLLLLLPPLLPSSSIPTPLPASALLRLRDRSADPPRPTTEISITAAGRRQLRTTAPVDTRRSASSGTRMSKPEVGRILHRWIADDENEKEEEEEEDRNNVQEAELAQISAEAPPPWPRFHEAPVFHNGQECATSRAAAPPALDEESSSWMCREGEAAVHVAMTLDANYLRGSVAAVLSILKHAACPEAVVFHFVAYPEAREMLGEAMRGVFPYLRFRVYAFEEAEKVRGKISAAVRAALEEPLNYARAYLPRILPRCLSRVIYLDSDIIVLDDIARLWEAELGGRPLGAPEYCHANFTAYFTSAFWSQPSLSSVFHGRRPCYFNTGVMVMDLSRFRLSDYTDAIEAWMEVQKEVRIYELGSLPPFLLVFAGDVAALDRRWNQHGLGGDNLLGRCRDLHPGPVSLLHWSGRGKPWVRLDNGNPCPLDSLWAAFDLAARPWAAPH